MKGEIWDMEIVSAKYANLDAEIVKIAPQIFMPSLPEIVQKIKTKEFKEILEPL